MKHLPKIFVVMFLVMLASCKPDENADNAVTSLRSKIVDYWSVDEQSQIYKSLKSKYSAEIIKHSTDSSKVKIDNFYNLGFGKMVEATVSDNYSIFIASQSVDGFLISGSGIIDHGLKKIYFSYIVDDQGGLIDTVTAVYSR